MKTLKKDLLPAALPSYPSKIIVSLSGGKDSTRSLLAAIEEFGCSKIIVVLEYLPDDWPGTIEHCQELCALLGVPFYVCYSTYYAMRCNACERNYISNDHATAWCHKCGAHDRQSCSHELLSVADLIAWRGKFPDLKNRFCTSYKKRDALNAWIRDHLDLVGDSPVLIMGERWAESRTREQLLTFEHRTLIRPGFLIVYHNILPLSRRQVFCDIRGVDVPLNPIYDLLWAEMLKVEHADWRAAGRTPHISYRGQWEGLYDLETLPSEVLTSMISKLKYEVEEEGHAPRYSCRACFLQNSTIHRAAYNLEKILGIERPAHEELLQIERQIGHKMTSKASLVQMLTAPTPQAGLWETMETCE